MQKLIISIPVLSFIMTFGFMQTHAAGDQNQERRELIKASRKELNEKATKAAQKEAKELRKEGWKTAPGALPLEKQLDRSYLMQMEFDDNMYPQYIMASAMSIGENYDAAKMQAIELAKQDIAGQIQTKITALVDNAVANKQLSAEQAASITKTVLAGKNLISHDLGRTIIIVEVYRTLSNKNKEVNIRIAYNSKVAEEIAKRNIYNELGIDIENLNSKVSEFDE